VGHLRILTVEVLLDEPLQAWKMSLAIIFVRIHRNALSSKGNSYWRLHRSSIGALSVQAQGRLAVTPLTFSRRHSARGLPPKSWASCDLFASNLVV